MVTRISKTFNELKLESQTGLITYLTAGFPNQDLCLEIINELSKSGSDLIEIGMPFSDPMAEGPIIQNSSKLSLDNGHTMELTFELINKFRKNNTKTPIILMGYYNPIYQYGNENFISRCLNDGVDGLIVVDLPPEHDSELCDLTTEIDLDFIRLATPTTNKKRLNTVLNKSSGFLYYVSVMGITGTKEPDLELLKKQVINLRKETDIPIGVGFGIKRPDQAKKISEFSDAIVVGSSLIEKIMINYKNNNEDDVLLEISEYIKSLKAVI